MIKPDEHVFITGGTGSGKTLLAVVMTAYIPNHIAVLDTKGKFSWLGLVNDDEIEIYKSLNDMVTSDIKTRKVIYRPPLEEMNNIYYDKFFEWCYNRGNTLVIVDEAAQVCKNAQSYPQWYKNILQRGREDWVSVWSLSQRPSNIAVDIMAQSTHFYVFRLNNIADRKKVANSSGQDYFLKKMKGHNFLYWRADKDIDPELNVLNISRR